MPYTPTGRPVGRPKTKDYRTISLKIPQDLLARVQAYARIHRQSISEGFQEQSPDFLRLAEYHSECSRR